VGVEVFGIRHHGPGSARSLVAALDAWQPDLLLIEGPPEATPLIGVAGEPALVPPVAILAYDPNQPGRAGFYPFASFSPEWQAIRWALGHDVPARFIDLPLVHALLVDRRGEIATRSRPEERPEAAGDPDGPEGQASAGRDPAADPEEAIEGEAAADEVVTEAGAAPVDIRLDPLGYMGRVAGEDGERWWERLVEERRDPADVFEAIVLLIRALRDEVETLPGDLLREAAMRTAIRAALAEEPDRRVAVVCGAWHAPALIDPGDPRADARLLKGLPKTKVETTWVPWSEAHLASDSGYGAGVESPGWYQHLWTTRVNLTESWMAKTARVLREEGLDVSSAHLIEASRLAETLSAMRGRGVPGLAEMLEASRATLTFGSDVPLRLVRERLIIGTGLGSIPETVESAPLARDLAAAQKRLRLAPETFEKTLELDLRGAIDLGRSHLLHQLRILDVPWGQPTIDQRQAMGTFRELWRLRWNPTFAVALITQSRWGNTIRDAAAARLESEAGETDAVAELAGRMEVAILADLQDAVRALLHRIAEASALASDVTSLMDALPALARSVRYGDVRGTDRATLAEVTDGIVVRVCVGLSLAVASLDDEAAAEMVARIEATEGAVSVLEREPLRTSWNEALDAVADQRNVHGRIAGRIVRILLDRGRLTSDEVAIRLGAAVSRGATPPDAAAFVEGFLAGPGALLVHDHRLFAIIDEWVSSQSDDAFTSVLPLLRRTFARFSAPERRILGERAKSGRTAAAGLGAGKARGLAGPAPSDGPSSAPVEAPAPPPASADDGFELVDDLLGLGGRE
jgi:hypothetical protein